MLAEEFLKYLQLWHSPFLQLSQILQKGSEMNSFPCLQETTQNSRNFLFCSEQCRRKSFYQLGYLICDKKNITIDKIPIDAQCFTCKDKIK